MIQRDSLALRTLLAAARQRNGLDEPRCRFVFEFLSTAADVQLALHRDLGKLNLTELKLGVLVVLFAIEPATATPADLATHTGATRSAITDVLDQLEAQGVVTRERDARDRRLVHIHLTDIGRGTADTALVRHLENVGRLAQHVALDAQQQFLASCAQLTKGSEQLSLDRKLSNISA